MQDSISLCGIHCGLCVLCHNNLLDITMDYSQPEHTPALIHLLSSTSLSSDTWSMIIVNKKGLLLHLPVSYHIQHHPLLLMKSIILAWTQPELQEVRERTVLRVIQMDMWMCTKPTACLASHHTARVGWWQKRRQRNHSCLQETPKFNICPPLHE